LGLYSQLFTCPTKLLTRPPKLFTCQPGYEANEQMKKEDLTILKVVHLKIGQRMKKTFKKLNKLCLLIYILTNFITLLAIS
jgi:hypothetical protein